MNKLFKSRGYVEEEILSTVQGANIDFQSLPAFLRVLLTTDGTVTKSLESYFWEPVLVEGLGQSYVSLEEAVPALEIEAGAKVIHRKVQLKGKKSEQVYTRATSLIRSELLPDEIRKGLEAGIVGVGEMLRECGLETYREIVEFGCNESAVDGQGSSVWRRYRITMNHRPFIQITEEFPLIVFGV